MLINGDCLSAMQKMTSESVDLVYLDPPFFTQKKQSLSDSQGTEYSFDDTWESIEDYCDFITKRIQECRRVLKNTGNIFLHCNTSASHHLRLILDKVFGSQNFRSEIIWFFKRWSNSKNGLLNSHQNILFYSKTDQYQFNKHFVDYSPTTNLDQILQDRIRDSSGKVVYKRDSQGDVVSSQEKRGVPLSDVWEIPFLNPKANERTGYPTQKPILLLERILEIGSNPGNMVLDPFCGSGTTLVAAKLMGRNFIGIDSSCDAIRLSEQRLNFPVKTNSRLMECGKEAYDTKSDFEKAILSILDCKIVQRNRGIDGISKKRYRNKLIAVKIQKPSENLYDAAKFLLHAGTTKNCGYFVLIKTHSDNELIHWAIPDNVLIMDSYLITLNKYLLETSELCSVLSD